MTLISHQKKFIFIHIYKTAGTAVTDYLIEYSNIKDRVAFDFYITSKIVNVFNRLFNVWEDGNKWVTGYHKHATAVEIEEYLGSSEYQKYYKFAFVRNPWDWQVSMYHYLKRTKVLKYYKLANQLNFKEFLQQYINNSPPLQMDFITDKKGSIVIDKIGKFENLSHDLHVIVNEIGILPENYNRKNLQLTNVSTNRKRDYRIYYDLESRDLVANYFKKDIDFFDYTFD